METLASDSICSLSVEPPAGWDRLMERAVPEHGYLRPVWYTAWAQNFLPYGNWVGPLRYLVAATRESCFAVMPLATQKIAFFELTSLAGPYAPFRDLPLDRSFSQPLADELAKALTNSRPPVGLRLGPVDERSPTANALVMVLRHRGWRVSKVEIGRQFVIALPASPKQYLSTLGKKKIKKINYYWRKMQQTRPSELIHYNDLSMSDWRRVIADVEDVEARSWVAERGEPKFMGARNQGFWQTLAADPWMSRALNVWMIYHDRRPVSYCVALDADPSRYIIANSYASEVADFSTGSIIYKAVITQAIGANLAEVHIGQGDPGYKRRWRANDVGGLIDVVAFPPGLRGGIASLAGRIRSWIEPRA